METVHIKTGASSGVNWKKKRVTTGKVSMHQRVLQWKMYVSYFNLFAFIFKATASLNTADNKKKHSQEL